MGTQDSTYISIITKNFLSTHIGYPAETFSVHGYPELSTFSRVVTGGTNGGSLNSAELYDSSTGIWTATSSMTNARYKHAASVLTNGKV